MGAPSPAATGWELPSSDTVTGLALLGLIVIIVVFAAQLEGLFTVCRNLNAYRRQLVEARRKIEQETETTLAAAEVIQQELPELQAAVIALGQDYEALGAQATEARKLHVQEVVMSDIFVQPGDRPYLAKIYRPNPDPDEPFAGLWQAGRDHVLYGADERNALRRFEQRYPADRGFRIGEIGPFHIPWTPRGADEDEEA